MQKKLLKYSELKQIYFRNYTTQAKPRNIYPWGSSAIVWKCKGSAMRWANVFRGR